jgi:hypothetical protein
MRFTQIFSTTLFALTCTFAACGGLEDQSMETADGALVKGGDLPNETCARRETNGTLTKGACNVVCKDKTIYEPNTDAEVDAVSSNGGVCNAAARRVPGGVVAPPVGGVLGR